MTELSELFPKEWVKHDIPDDPEDIIGKEFQYLDHGFVQLVDYMGDDMAVADGARSSFRESADNYSDSRNRGLINYLTEHKHTSPSELAVVKFRIRVPLSVRAQHVRHRTQSCNWESHRYQEPKHEYYVPPEERIRNQDAFNKQGSGEPLGRTLAISARGLIGMESERAWNDYNSLLERGVSRETARDMLHSNFYTTGVFQMNLRNMFHYLKLRTDSHAQPEIRLLATMIEKIVAKIYPMSYDAWLEFDKHSVSFSRSEMEALREFLSDLSAKYFWDEFCDHNDIDLGSKRRMRDFYNKLFPGRIND